MADLNTASLRPVTDKDMDLIFQWRNDPWIISLGSSQKTVTKTEHQSWFKNTLKDNKITIFIVEINKEPAGQIRFSQNDLDSCIVSMYLMKPFIGKGYGVPLLQLACQKIISKWWPLTKIIAYIQDTNKHSLSAFKKAGFIKYKKGKPLKNHACVIFKMEK